MTRDEFMYGMVSPIRGADLRPYKEGGHLMQGWADHPELYSPNHGELFGFTGGHTGIDIWAPFRTPVLAAHDGYIPAEMIFNDPIRPGGREVWNFSDPFDVEAPGNSQACTVSCHLDEIAVKGGQRVEKDKTVLGFVGNTGFVVSGGVAFWGNAPAGKGIHLHFGLYERVLKNGQWQMRYDATLPQKGSSDPLPFITETAANPRGDLSGMMRLLKNLTRYVQRPRA